MAEHFCAEINRLEGTIVQRRKNFFSLLNANTTLRNQPEMLHLIASDWKPQSQLEFFFKTEFLIYFRRTPELYDLLKEGNYTNITKITKQQWFLQEVFRDVPVNELVNNLLPYMSYSLRMKVLKKITKFMPEEKFDEIFDAVKCRYGIYIASRIITGCSCAKLQTVLADYENIRFNTHELKILYKKNPNFIDFYFNRQQFYYWNYRSLLSFIKAENPEHFKRLQEKFDVNMERMGRRSTRKYILNNKNTILKNIWYYKDKLHMPIVLRTLRKETSILFCNALPDKIEDLKERRLIELVTLFNQEDHYNLYVKSLQEHYKKKLIDYPHLIDSFLLKLLTDNNERALYAKVKYEEGNLAFMKHLLISESIPLIKEKINVTSDVSKRSNYTLWLLETCHINNDKDALIEVIKYFIIRHKNERFETLLDFIHKIGFLFDFQTFNDTIWEVYNELLTVYMVKYTINNPETTLNKMNNFPILTFAHSNHSQIITYLQFLFEKNEPIDELLLQYLQGLLQCPNWSNYRHAFRKYCIIFMIENSKKIALKQNVIQIECNIIASIAAWNHQYTNDILNFYDYPNLVDSFYYEIRNNHPKTEIKTILREPIFALKQDKNRDEFLTVYWDRLDIYASCEDLKWFLKYEPQQINNHLEAFVDYTFKLELYEQRTMWYLLRKVVDLHLDQNVITYCQNLLENDKKVDQKFIIIALSVLLSPEDYIIFADGHAPINTILQCKDEEVIGRSQFQRCIALNFNKIRTHQCLPSLLQYCVGEFFGAALQSLHRLLYLTPENQLPQFFNELSSKSGSVTKHVIYFAANLTSIANVEAIFKQINETENIDFVKERLFETTVQYFIKNPVDSLFEIVKSNMLSVTKTDSESLYLITSSVNKIHLRYRSEYIQYSCEYLEKLIDIWHILKPLKESLINSISDGYIAKNIPFEFGARHIRDNLLKPGKTLSFNCISVFTFRFLTNRPEKDDIFKLIFGIVNESSPKDTFLIFNDWHKRIMELQGPKLDYFKQYVDYWASKIDPIQYFYKYSQLFFVKTKVEVQNCDGFVARLGNFIQSLQATYGFNILGLFSNALKANINYFINTETRDIHVYNKILIKFPIQSVHFVIMALVDVRALNREDPTEKELFELLQKASFSDVQMKILFNHEINKEY